MPLIMIQSATRHDGVALFVKTKLDAAAYMGELPEGCYEDGVFVGFPEAFDSGLPLARVFRENLERRAQECWNGTDWDADRPRWTTSVIQG